MQWILRPQECGGSYFFSGTFYVTREVHETIPIEDVLTMYRIVRYLAYTREGLDYLQVFEHAQSDQRVYLIDQLSTDMIESAAYSQDDNYCTLLYAHEY